MNRKCIKIGHRGASGYEPENTLSAFSRAIALGVDMIELDVHLCKSGEVVVIHDEDLERTTNGRGRVSEITLEELKKLDAGRGESIPLLDEVITLVNKRCAINIELKGAGTALPTVNIVRTAIREQGWSEDDFLLSSFSREELVATRDVAPHIKAGLNISEAEDDFSSFASAMRLFSIHPGTDIVSKELVDKIHSLQMKVYVWTADKVEQIRWLKDIGVDGIFSNYPDRLDN